MVLRRINTQMRANPHMAPCVLTIFSMTVFKDPTALPLMVNAFCVSLSPLLNRMDRKGLSIPSDIRPNKVESRVKTRYITNLPLYFDRYCRMRENFFIVVLMPWGLYDRRSGDLPGSGPSDEMRPASYRNKL